MVKIFFKFTWCKEGKGWITTEVEVAYEQKIDAEIAKGEPVDVKKVYDEVRGRNQVTLWDLGMVLGQCPIKDQSFWPKHLKSHKRNFQNRQQHCGRLVKCWAKLLVLYRSLMKLMMLYC